MDFAQALMDCDTLAHRAEFRFRLTVRFLRKTDSARLAITGIVLKPSDDNDGKKFDD